MIEAHRKKVSLVTGAGSGIGAAIAESFAERGDIVVCTDIDRRSAEATAARIPGAAAEALDVRDADATQDVVDRIISTHGRLDVVVPNAAVFHRDLALSMTEKQFDDTLDVNVRGAFLTAQAGANAMIQNGTGGSVVFIGSIHSIRAMRQQAAYAASKGAVKMMSSVMAVEWAKFQIRVNCIGPGFTETPATAATRANPERLEAMMKRVPMRRIGQPAEIANCVRFLSSDDASFITGAYLNVDGGWLSS